MIKSTPLAFASALALLAAALSCRDAAAPRPAGRKPGAPVFVVFGPQPAIRGVGAFGTATPAPGADREDFDFDVAQDLTGRVLYNDWRYNAWVKVNPADPQTAITAFRNQSAQCPGNDPANGAEVDGTGRRENGILQAFTLIACDLGPAGSGADFFQITFPSYIQKGFPSGDIVKTVVQSTGGDLQVTTSTSGSGLPDGYSVTVDQNPSRPIGINASETFTALTAGSHTVVLSGVPSNCTVSDGATRTVTVPSAQTVTVSYAVSCVTPPGNLDVTTTTTGSSLPNGYAVTVDQDPSRPIGINATETFTALTAGSHTVVLSGVPSNCTLSDGATRTVTVPSAQTATVSYSVSCVTPNTTPTVNAGPDEQILLGLLYELRWSFTDPDNGPWQYTISWGDGSSSSGTLSSAGSYTASHGYLLGSYTIRVTVTDGLGASGSDAKKLTVLVGGLF